MSYVIALVIASLLSFGTWYFWLPPINLSAPSFWFFAIVILAYYAIALYIAGMFSWSEEIRPAIVLGAAAVGVFLILVVGWLAGSEFFSANTYANQLKVETTSFEEEFAQVDWNTVPQIDYNSANILGARKMGTLVNEVSQFNAADSYTLINYGGKPVRVTPLVYAGFWKYVSNNDDGIPGYIIVDCISKESEFVRLEDGINYSPSAYWGKDLKRHLRFKFPSTLFDEFSFEIDDDGNPYFVVPTYTYEAGFGGAKAPSGCILVDPITGDCTEYSLNYVPSWIDHAIEDDTAVELINNWGTYQDGFWNSIFGQKNVRVSTEGHNFVTLGNDVYLYTGITSVSLDESNIGFMLVNMRTSEAKYFDLPSAEEYSAMDSAKGQVQHLNYSSTFPILINIEGAPTYFLSLKDAAGLVKMYALVSVENIQQLVVLDSTSGIDVLVEEYLEIIGYESSQEEEKVEAKSVTFVVANVYTATLNGNTQYYFEDGNGNIYMSDISQSITLPTIAIGDTITITYTNTGVNKYFSIISFD